MGCCLSANKPAPSIQSDKCGGAPPPEPPYAPPASFEEETVKEVVLSEIPIPKPAQTKNKSDRYEVPESQDLKIEVEPMAEIKRPKESTVASKPAEDAISEVTEHFELCSFTESFSTNTTATATGVEKRDDEEVTQQSPMRARRKRPNTGDVAGARERRARSPARRPMPSPEKKKPAASRHVQGRAMGPQRRNVGAGQPSNGLRRESSDGSTHRSRSPVTRGQGGPRQNVRHRSPGHSENGRPGGGWSPARALDNGFKAEKSNDDVFSESSKAEKPNGGVSDENGESLENPLVSLECFIFL